MEYRLYTINDVKEFVNICNKYKGRIRVYSDDFIVDGKSIFGLFSLNLLKPMRISIESDMFEVEDFYREISKFLI